MKRPASGARQLRKGARRSASASPRVFIIGTGRLGSSLARALDEAGWSVATEQRTAARRQEATRQGLPGARFPLREADVVLLCARDGQIEELAAKLSSRVVRGQVVAHCAGALDLTPLAPLRRRGVHVGSLHPLISVPTHSTVLRGSCTVAGSAPAARRLEQVARAAGLEPIGLRTAERTLYHAAAVLAANGTVSLADEAVRIFCRCGMKRNQALQATVGLIRSAADALEREGLPGAITGPIARGDLATVQKHFDALFALDHDPGHALYRAISFNLLALAQTQGQASEHQLLAVFAQVLREQQRGYARYKLLAPM